MKSLILIVLAGLMGAVSYAQTDESWELRRDKEDIKVFTRAQEGWPIKGFRAETNIKASTEDLIETVLNATEFTAWMNDMKKSSILETKPDGTVITYYELSIPWPMQNRDAVGAMLVREEDETTYVEVDILTDYLPEYPKLVRMTRSVGFWSFTKSQDGGIDVVYQFIADPEGNVPGWIANLFLVDGPYQTLINLRERLEM